MSQHQNGTCLWCINQVLPGKLDAWACLSMQRRNMDQLQLNQVAAAPKQQHSVPEVILDEAAVDRRPGIGSVDVYRAGEGDVAMEVVNGPEGQAGGTSSDGGGDVGVVRVGVDETGTEHHHHHRHLYGTVLGSGSANRSGMSSGSGRGGISDGGRQLGGRTAVGDICHGKNNEPSRSQSSGGGSSVDAPVGGIDHRVSAVLVQHQEQLWAQKIKNDEVTMQVSLHGLGDGCHDLQWSLIHIDIAQVVF